MIKLTDLKPGDLVRIQDEGGIEREGVIVDVRRDDNMICVDNGIQEFWYPPEAIAPIPLTEDRLVNLLGFEREDTPDGTKYKKGAFRVLIHDQGNNTHLDIWYREDRRHFEHPLYVHELQNHHLDMTKVPLEKGVLH